MIKWISESEELPEVGQEVLLCYPRQFDKFWDIQVGMILKKHEGVAPRPIMKGGKWPTDYFWGVAKKKDSILITGNGYWAKLDAIPLPNLAEHVNERGYHYISQTGDAFVPQNSLNETKE